MRTYRKTVAGLLAGGLLMLGLAAPDALAQKKRTYDHEQVVEKTFQVQPGQRLSLDTDFGTVRVAGGSGNAVVVRVVKGADDVSESKAQEAFDRFRLDFDQTSGGLAIRGDYDGEHRWRRDNHFWVEYEVTVPRRFDVAVKTSGGSIHAEDFQGQADLNTAGGSVTALEIDGPVALNTSGGSITAEQIGGQARLNTSGGSITAREVKGAVDANTSGGSITVERAGGDVEAHTSGGGIRLADVYGTADASTSGGSIEADLAVQPDAPMKLETSGGSITLRLDPGTRADLDAKASGGSVKTDLPVTVEGEVERSRLRGAINGGGPLLTLRSSGGGIRIYKR